MTLAVDERKASSPPAPVGLRLLLAVLGFTSVASLLGWVYGGAIAVFVSWAATSFGGMYGASDMAAVRESLIGRVSDEVVQRAVTVPARAIVGDRFVASGVARQRAEAIFQRWKAWLIHNNAMVLSILLLVFGVLMIGGGLRSLPV